MATNGLPRDVVEAMLTCPISLGFMRDPVLILQSGQTYDRESLCQSLLLCPTLCPLTGQRFDEKLTYTDNLLIRQFLTSHLGDDAYQKYDDSGFKRWYEALVWNEQEGRWISAANSTDTDTYEELAALLYGMNRREIDLAEAQRMAENASQEDAVVTGFKALLLHPKVSEVFSSDRLRNDEDEALRVWERAELLGLIAGIAAGNAWAQWLKGVFELFVMNDYNSARHYYELAVVQGSPAAQFDLGFLYRNGLGVPQDYEKAKEYYKQAAEQGHSAAQNNLGFLYYNGLGVPQDYEKARYYYELAAEQGNASAQYNLGCTGLGTQSNDEKANQYFEQAAAQGDVEAQKRLDRM